MSKILRIVSVLVVLVMIAGCVPATSTTVAENTQTPDQSTQPGATSTQAQAATIATNEAITLSYIRPGVGDDALKENTAEMAPFYEKYPYITLDPLIVAPGDLSQKLQTSVAGGEPPDIAYLDAGSAIKYINSGQLLDLTPYAEADGFDWQSYYDTKTLEFFNPSGSLYCVNETNSSQALAYNKEMFDAAGLAYPTDDWTWDDLLTAAQTLTKDTNGDGTTDQWGLVISTSDYWAWINAAGGNLFNADFTETLITDQVAIDTLQWLADLRFNYKVSPTQDLRDVFPVEGFLFSQGQAAMYIANWVPDVSLFFPAISTFTYDVVLTPKNPTTGLRPSGKSPSCIGVFASTEHPEEAYLAWKWLTSDEGNYYRSVGNTGTPLLPGGPADQWPMLSNAFTEVTTPMNANAFIQMIDLTSITAIPRENQSEIYDTIDPILDELWLGTKTAAEVAPLIKAAVDPLLQE
jgi:multiple sugar transport system substrate-binding protein